MPTLVDQSFGVVDYLYYLLECGFCKPVSRLAIIHTLIGHSAINTHELRRFMTYEYWGCLGLETRAFHCAAKCIRDSGHIATTLLFICKKGPIVFYAGSFKNDEFTRSNYNGYDAGSVPSCLQVSELKAPSTALNRNEEFSRSDRLPACAIWDIALRPQQTHNHKDRHLQKSAHGT